MSIKINYCDKPESFRRCKHEGLFTYGTPNIWCLTCVYFKRDDRNYTPTDGEIDWYFNVETESHPKEKL